MQQITLFYPKTGGLSLTLMDQRQTYYPKCNPKQLSNETQWFNCDGSMHSTHNTANICDLSVSNQEQISFVETFSLISQQTSAHSKQDFKYGHVSHIHSQSASHILWMNLHVHAINATLHMKNGHIFRHTSSMGVIGISQSILAHTSKYFHHIQFMLCIFGKASHFFHRNP